MTFKMINENGKTVVAVLANNMYFDVSKSPNGCYTFGSTDFIPKKPCHLFFNKKEIIDINQKLTEAIDFENQ